MKNIIFIFAMFASLCANAQDTKIPGNLYVGGGVAVTGSITAANVTNSGLTATRVPYAGTAGLLTDSANMTFTSGTGTLTALVGSFGTLIDSGLTITRVPYAGTGGQLLDSASMFFNSGTGQLTVGKLASGTIDASGLITSTVTSGSWMRNLSATTNALYYSQTNTGGSLYWGVENNSGAGIFPGTAAYATVFGTDQNTPVQFISNNQLALSMLGTTVTVPGDIGFASATTNNPQSGMYVIKDYSETGASAFIVGHDNGSSTGTVYGVWNYNAGTIGSITQSGTTAVLYNTTSDYRLKKNAIPLTGAATFIAALRPKSWEWESDGSRGVGFIAHEAQAIAPLSVSGSKDAVDAAGKPVYQGMQAGSSEIIANLVAHQQELTARIAALELLIRPPSF